MRADIFEVGDRVRVTNYSHLRGLRGTIRKVDLSAYDADDVLPLLYYQIDLEDAHLQEPVWFHSEEVGSLSE